MAIHYRRRRRGLRKILEGSLFVIICGGIACTVYYIGSRPTKFLNEYIEKKIEIVKIEPLKIDMAPASSQESKFPPQPTQELEIKSPALILDGMPPEVDVNQPIRIKVVLNLEHPDKMRQIPTGFKIQSIENCPVDYEIRDNYVLIGDVLTISEKEGKLIPTVRTAASSATEISIQSLHRIKIATDREVREAIFLYNNLSNERERLKLILEKPGPKPWASVKIAQGRIKELDRLISIQEITCKNWLIEFQKINESIKLFQELNGKMKIQLVQQ